MLCNVTIKRKNKSLAEYQCDVPAELTMLDDETGVEEYLLRMFEPQGAIEIHSWNVEL